MSIELKYKEECVPKSLLCLCYKYIVHHLETICFKTPEGYTLHENLILPGQICDGLIENYQNNGFEFTNSFAHLFKDTTRTKLRSVHICDSKTVTVDGLEHLLRHELYEFKLTNCPSVKPYEYKIIFDRNKSITTNLRSLIIRSPTELADVYYTSLTQLCGNINNMNTPNLKHLVLHSIIGRNSEKAIINALFDKLLQLKILDLSYWYGEFNFLNKLTRLHTLILYNVLDLDENDTILNICSLKSLVILDISKSDYYSRQDTYKDGNKTLALIVESLPNLMSLDISGTNLDGEGRLEHSMYESLSGNISDIPGLEHRVDNPLEFIGLFRTMHNACQRQNIPAKRISGDANEEQLFNCVFSSMEKPELLRHSLGYLMNLGLACQLTAQIDHAPDTVLKALSSHVKNEYIQLNGSAVIYYILKNKDLPLFNDIKMKRRIVTTLLTGMEHQNNDGQLAYYVCMSLNKLTQDMMFEFKRLVKMLLHVLLCQTSRDRVGLLGVVYVFKVLNSVASQANNRQKNELGDAYAIEIMISILNAIFRGRQHSNVVEITWSIMRNLTDNAPNNSEIFLNEDGLECFLECLQTFWYQNRLKTEMLRLIGNIAQVKELRSRLMESQYIRKFSNLVFPIQDEIKISYYAVRIIAYLASDGYEVWNIKEPSRNIVLDRLTTAILGWDLDSDLGIIQHSFESILQLAQVRHTPQCIHYATWSLANFTKKYPEKYCSMVIAKGGLRIMSELLEDQSILYMKNQCEAIHGLSQIVINQCLMYKQTIDKETTE